MSKEDEITEVTSPSAQAVYREYSSMLLPVDQKDSESREMLLGSGGKPREKFLWWHMTKTQRVFVIIALVTLVAFGLLVIVWFAVVPAVVQHYINNVQMELNYIDILSIPDSETLVVDLSLSIQHDVAIAATTGSTFVSLFYDGTEFATLPFPELDINTGSQSYNITIDADMPITDQKVLNAMLSDLMNAAEISLAVTALLDMQAFGVSLKDLSFERDLAVKGFASFSDPKPLIKEIELTTCSSSEYKFIINVTMDNVAQIGLEGIGEFNMSLYNGQQYLGYALSQKPDLGIPRGVSNQSFSITVDAATVSISDMLISGLTSSSQFYIVGNNPYVTMHKQFAEALSNVNMSVSSSRGSFTNMKVGPTCDLLSLLG